MDKICECGCGQLLDFKTGRKRKKYIHGHYVRVNNAGALARTGVSSWNKGIPRTDEEKALMSKNRKGIVPDGFVSPFYIDGRYKNDPNSIYNQYGGSFSNELKKSARLRDRFICQNCGKKRSTLCHHIDENKLNNVVNNLVVLCRQCHGHFHTEDDDVKLKLTEIFKEKVAKNERVNMF